MITYVAVGGSHVLVLQEGGELLAWGSNQYGQLGCGSTRVQKAPVLVLEHVRAVAAGEYHSMAVNEDGDLHVWGCNSSGQLGDGTTEHRAEPKVVLKHIDLIAAGGGHSLALQKPPPKGLKRQTLFAWGMDACEDGSARCTITGVAMVLSPQRIWEDSGQDGRAIVAIACGRNHSMAVVEDGACLTWGRNGHGQLGDGLTRSRLEPTKVADGVAAVSAGLEYSLAVTRDGRLLAWGCNGSARLGTGDLVDRLLPTEVFRDVAAAVAGVYHAVALLSNGDCVGWGCNLHDCLGHGLPLEVVRPTRVLVSGAWKASLGTHQTFALMGSGEVFTWGLQARDLDESMQRCREFVPKPKRPGADDLTGTALASEERQEFHFSEERYVHPPLADPAPPDDAEGPGRRSPSPPGARPPGGAQDVDVDWQEGGLTAVLDGHGQRRAARLVEQVHQRARQRSRAYAVRWAAFRRGRCEAEGSQGEALRAFHAELAAEVVRFREDLARLDDVAAGGWTPEQRHPTTGVLAMAELLEAVLKEVLAANPRAEGGGGGG